VGRRGGNRGGGVDWVYRGDSWAMVVGGDHVDSVSGSTEGPFSDGTYGSVVNSVLNDERLGLVLIDSDRHRQITLGSTVTPSTGTVDMVMRNPAANPESPKDGPLVHGSDIEIYMYLGTDVWSTSPPTVYLGLRIIIAEQDPYDGTPMVHTNYHMWGQVGGLDSVNSNPAEYANGRQNCWESRWYHERKQTNVQIGSSVFRARPRFKRRLAYDEGLFLYIEPHPNSETIGFIQTFCRSLVTKRA